MGRAPSPLLKVAMPKKQGEEEREEDYLPPPLKPVGCVSGHRGLEEAHACGWGDLGGLPSRMFCGSGLRLRRVVCHYHQRSFGNYQGSLEIGGAFLGCEALFDLQDVKNGVRGCFIHLSPGDLCLLSGDEPIIHAPRSMAATGFRVQVFGGLCKGRPHSSSYCRREGSQRWPMESPLQRSLVARPLQHLPQEKGAYLQEECGRGQRE